MSQPTPSKPGLPISRSVGYDRQVLAFEEVSEETGRPVRDLFPEDLDLPPAETLSKPKLIFLLKLIRGILAENGIELGFVSGLPDVTSQRLESSPLLDDAFQRALRGQRVDHVLVRRYTLCARALSQDLVKRVGKSNCHSRHHLSSNAESGRRRLRTEMNSARTSRA